MAVTMLLWGTPAAASSGSLFETQVNDTPPSSRSHHPGSRIVLKAIGRNAIWLAGFLIPWLSGLQLSKAAEGSEI
jgi:hypothetical protein